MTYASATLVSAPTGADAPAAPANTTVAAQSTAAPETPAAQSQQGSELIGGKFKSTDDLLAAYKALESKLGQSTATKGEAPATTGTPATETPATPDAAQQAVQNAGLNFDALSTEFAEKGDLTPESYQALEKAGIPKPMVDAYIAGQKALAEAQAQQLYSLAGGQDSFAKMTEWAGANLTDAEIAAYNEAVTKGSVDQAKLAVSGLHARFAAAEGVRPNLVTGQTNAKPVGYQSVQEMTRDMNDPRYISGDPAFHAMVDAKIANAAF
jgi:hypothetical protein